MRALLAVVLSMVVLSLYQYFFVPTPAPEEIAARQEARQLDEAVSPEPEIPQEERPPTLPSAEVVTAESATELVVDGGRYRAVVTNRGGRLASFELAGYTDDFGNTLDLVHPGARAVDQLMLGLATPSDPAVAEAANQALYRVTVDGLPVSTTTLSVESEPVAVEFAWSDGSGRAVRKRIVFPPAGYQLDLQVEADLRTATWVQLGPGLNPVANRSSMAFLSEGAVILDEAGDLEHWDTGDLDSPVVLQGSYRWGALESHYFLGALLVEGPTQLRLSYATVDAPAAPPTDTEEATDAEAGDDTVDLVVLQAEVPEAGLGAPLLLAPKRYQLLADEGHDLQRVVDFGWFGIIARPLLFLLIWINSFVGNYGVAIILLTVLLRIVFLPLNHKAMISMRRTQQLQPQMAAIRNKYKGVKDLEKRQKMNEEVMELYRREGVSPLGGCLPMLAQLPILFAFYRLLSVSIELRGAPFVLWIQDLAQHDPYYVLPLLMGASMLVQQRMTPTSGVNPAQARMMKLMPILFTAMFISVPSGLVLYWTTNNVLGIAQQVYVNRTLEQPATPKGGKGRKKGQRGKRGKKS